MTESDLPTFVVRLQLSRRGDVRWDLLEGASPWRTPEPGDWGGWAEPDEVWPELRRQLPVAVATWVHRLARADGGDSGSPLPTGYIDPA